MSHVRKYTVALVAVVSLFGAGLAFAAWTANGTGTGSVKATTSQALTTEAVAVTGALYPSGTANVSIRINNPNPFQVTVTAITGSGTITSDNATCNANGTGVSYADQSGLSLVVPANSAQTFVLASAASMSNASDNACQGATFAIPVSISAASS
jgi:hypothetical protein